VTISLQNTKGDAMKLVKYMLALALGLAFVATPNVSHAQTIQYLATGSSALFLELGQAAGTLTGCYWTHKTDTTATGIAARDDRPSIPAGHTDENGNVWIAWGPGTGTCAAPAGAFDIYAEMNLDSVLGDRCFFMVNASSVGGCLWVQGTAAGAAGNPTVTGACAPPALPCSLLGNQPTWNDTPLPAAVLGLLSPTPPTPAPRIFVAATDIRPEDAKFASARALTACGSPIARNPYETTSFYTAGLGYQTATTGIGVDIQDFTNPGTAFHVYDFNISGTDPLSGASLTTASRSPYTVSTVGAQPEVVVVSPSPTGSTGISAATDITFSTLSEYLIGGFGRANDLLGPSSPYAVTTFIREPLSGTYNVMEYSVPNSNEFKTTQELFNCSGANVGSNPMNIASANGRVTGARKVRSIGTGHVVAALQNSAFCAETPTANNDCLGYFFWSSANAAAFTATNGKYLTVNGVDPLLDSYGDACVTAVPLAAGQLPNATVGGLSCVTFKNLNAGDYAIWSALRLVSTSPTPVGVTNLITAAQTAPATVNDFIPIHDAAHVSVLKQWKSHYNLLGLGITNNSNGMTVNPFTPGDLCSLAASSPEGGGDAGAITIGIHANNDFCTDFGAAIGINDKNQ
jgi:hypothetical protein